jgi:hypothetical protein
MKLRLVRIAWLGMAVAFIAAGINAVAREGLVVAIVLGATAVGLMAAVLIPGAIVGWFATSHAKKTAEDKPRMALIAAEVALAERQARRQGARR